MCVAFFSHITVLLQDRSGSRLLETVFELGGAEIVSSLFACHMRGRLLELSKHAIANFCVQHLLQSVRSAWRSAGRHILRDAFEELSPAIQELCCQTHPSRTIRRGADAGFPEFVSPAGARAVSILGLCSRPHFARFSFLPSFFSFSLLQLLVAAASCSSCWTHVCACR